VCVVKGTSAARAAHERGRGSATPAGRMSLELRLSSGPGRAS
jgi:hypothetical protein